jgi:glycosyltransferase involved in cell wall biosynthesis
MHGTLVPIVHAALAPTVWTSVSERQPQTFHILAVEGPDAYACAGGIASRVSGLAKALADAGHETHLWFVGDPELPGCERQGLLTLHRWCQWISHHHRNGVYDGEEGKVRDYSRSLPPFLFEQCLHAQLVNGGRAVVLAEEWQTVDAVLHLHWLLQNAGLRERVTLFWNANNTFGFDRIDWKRLENAATITTVSRYMKHRMWACGVDAIVIPNGLGAESFQPPDENGVAELRRRFADRVLLAKVARWDPDKRWLLAIDTVAELKSRGARPLLLARGGVEAHQGEVMERARRAGLRVLHRSSDEGGVAGLLSNLASSSEADLIVLQSRLDAKARGVLFQAADAVLANSGHEPFGLVGLEAMAAGGLACTGASGEDYAIDGQNALVLQQNDPREFVSLFSRLRTRPESDRPVRASGMRTAHEYAWPRIVERALLPRL